MYCPKCAFEVNDDTKFCRSCGADISLVALALTGQGAAALKTSDQQSPEASQRMTRAITTLFAGIGFIVAALCILMFVPGGNFWWFWVLIPALTLIGGGVADYVQFRTVTRIGKAPKVIQTPEQRLREHELANNGLNLTLPPASVTENTTRRLGERADSDEVES